MSLSTRAAPPRRRVLQVVLAAAVAAAAAGFAGVPARPARPSSYIVRVEGTSLDAVARQVRASGGKVTRQLAGVGMLLADLPSSGAARLMGVPGVVSITPDHAVRLAASGYDQASDPYSVYSDAGDIGARAAWARSITGRGVDVALVDSGVSPVAGLDRGKIVDGPDLSFDSQNPKLIHRDAFGHGTHLAGIIAGHDTGVVPSATSSGGFLGIAPGARIINVKVADAFGASDVSQVIAGIDWVVQHAHDPGLNIRVLNLSFGTSSSQSYQVDPLAFAAETAWAHGIVVVVSAGNDGTAAGRLSDPAIDPFVLAVGAAETNGTKTGSDDTVTDYSSRGDGTRNPDLVAPGQHVASLRVPGSFVDQQFGAGPGSVNSRFLRGSGTSQAAAMVSGAAALVLQQRPRLSPDQVKSLLTATTSPLSGADPSSAGSGLVNVSRAIVSSPGPGAQGWQPSAGTGSLEAARGGDLVLNGTALNGEVDIFGGIVDSAQLAAKEAAAAAWTGGSWNGNTWTAAAWQALSWPGVVWTSTSWAGSGWTGLSWDDGSWTGLSWDNSSWTGLSWDTSRWSGTNWEGLSWDTYGWS